jgi:hypothetical protein
MLQIVVIDLFAGSGGLLLARKAGGKLGATDLHAITVRPETLQRRCRASIAAFT